MATTKFRHTFKYLPDDSEDDDIRRALDDEGQEQLIARLRAENEERNDEYLRLFLAIPFGSVMTFMPALFMSPLYQVKFICFLCISSLLATAYILVFVPNEKPGMKSAPRKPIFEPATGPVVQYLPYLNGALSLLLAVNALNWRGRRGVHQGFWILCLLPAIVMSSSIAARRTMLDVDIDELEKLKYDYKGA